MSTLLTGSICLSDIPKDKITESTKNGKKYLNITLWVNDAPDQYGNDASISVNQTKDEREAGAKKTYIGNLKRPQAAAITAPSNDGLSDDDLPF